MRKTVRACAFFRCDLRFSCESSCEKVRPVGEWLRPGEDNCPGDGCERCNHLVKATVLGFFNLPRVISTPGIPSLIPKESADEVDAPERLTTAFAN